MWDVRRPEGGAIVNIAKRRVYGTLDELPRPSQLGRARLGGVDMNKLRMRAALAVAPAPGRLHHRRVHRQGPRHDRAARSRLHHPAGRLRPAQTPRKHLLDKPGRARRYQVPPAAARTIAALLTLRDQVIGPILAGVRSPRLGRKPAHWTAVDRHYENLRTGMQDLFHDLGITIGATAA